MAATSSDLRELASFLVHCSKNSLADYYLKRLDQAAHLERDLRDVARSLVDTLASVELAAFLRDYGEEIIGANPQRALIAAQPKPARTSLPFCGQNWFGLVSRSDKKDLNEPDVCDSSKPATYLRGYEKLVLLVLVPLMQTPDPEKGARDDDGWSSKITLEDIGRRADMSPKRARIIVADLKKREILNCKGRNGDEWGLQYSIWPKAKWRVLPEVETDAAAEPAKSEKPKRVEFRGHVTEESAQFHFGHKVIDVQGRPQLTLAHGDGSPAAEFEIGLGNPVFYLPHGSLCKGMSSTRPPMDGRGVESEQGTRPPVHGRGVVSEQGTRPPADGRGLEATAAAVPFSFSIQVWNKMVTGRAPERAWTDAEIQTERRHGSYESLVAFLRGRGATDLKVSPHVLPKNSRAHGTNPRALSGAVPAIVRAARVGQAPSAEAEGVRVNPAALERARLRDLRERELSGKQTHKEAAIP